MKQRGIKISKALIRAILLSFVAEAVVGTVIYLLLIAIPGTAWADWKTFTTVNHNNPEIFFSNEYQKLAPTLNMEDWLIVTPISFLVGGITFGLTLLSRHESAYIAKASAIVSIVWSVFILTLGNVGTAVSDSSSYGYRLPMPRLSWEVVAMAIVQSVFWTVFFVVGSLAPVWMRRAKKQRSAGSLA